jgi:hypothetical protein
MERWVSGLALGFGSEWEYVCRERRSSAARREEWRRRCWIRCWWSEKEDFWSGDRGDAVVGLRTNEVGDVVNFDS